MGCPSGTCTGYELRADLSFDENGDGQMTATGDPTYWNSGSGWLPLGTYTAATFRGNGHIISYLYINRSLGQYQGLFSGLHADSSVDGVGVLHADVAARQDVGILAGRAAGSITRVWTTGRVAGRNLVGGLVSNVTGDIKASWSAAAVHASSGRAGGLTDTLVLGSITASWSAGRVTATSGGGLVGAAVGSTITDSYWDTGTSGWSTSGGGTGKSTRELQRPTAYGSTGSIYANWNIDTDGVTGGDDPWDFGTSRQYPALKFTGRATPDRGPARIEADHWNAPVAGEPLVAGLHSKTSRALVTPAATITTCDGVANTDSRQAWTWERSDDGRTSWTTVTSTRGPACSYVYVPSSTDVGKYLRARVPRTSGGDAYTLTTAAVVASSAATSATASFAGGNASPVVGVAVMVSPLPTHSDRTLWRWQRCTASDGTGTCTLLAPGEPSWSYTPVAADMGGYLRAFVYYSSSASTPVWTRAATAFTGAVAASN